MSVPNRMFHLPSRAVLWLYVRINIALTLLFVIIYGGANALAARKAAQTTLFMPWELGIPFVPGALLVYQSIGILFWLPLFVFDEMGLRHLAWRFAGVTCVAGVIFILFPVRAGFGRPEVNGLFQQAYAVLRLLDHPYNTVPSLHIAYSTLLLGALYRVSGNGQWRCLWAFWWSAIGVSVLWVHQHHVVDVVAGAVLGAAFLHGMSANRDEQEKRPDARAMVTSPE
jgi:membrane-associated phospholipid phosphatase